MKKFVTTLPLIALLAACGGGGGAGPQTISGGSIGGIGGGTPPGTGGGSGETHSFVKPTLTKSYDAAGAVQSFTYSLTDEYRYAKMDDPQSTTTPRARIADPNSRLLIAEYQGEQLYTANISTIRSPGISVTYDPQNAQYTLRISQNGVTQNSTFQDPAHRTDFGGASEPQAGVPNLEIPNAAGWRDKGVQYLQVWQGDADNYDWTTFFYELPGTSTKYVTYAGYVRNRYEKPSGEKVTRDTDALQETKVTQKVVLDRAAFAFGELTPLEGVPRTGTATYTGSMIGSMVFNPTLDSSRADSYFQWLSGTATVSVDFGASSVQTQLRGIVHGPHLVRGPLVKETRIAPGLKFDSAVLPENTNFSARGTARIDLPGTGGFTGSIESAGFSWNGGGSTANVDIAGSSLQGAFYGPSAAEVGGAFRIVGGIPDQRVDIIGSFTGSK